MADDSSKRSDQEATAYTTPGPVTQAASGNQATVTNTSEVQPHEAPAPSALARGQGQPASAVSSDGEDVLAVEQIQGNILPGFNKDHQTLLFLKIRPHQEDNFRQWLTALVPYIATVADVQSFNSLWKRLHERIGENTLLQATWVNIAFSYKALNRLTRNASAFNDHAFREGLAHRSHLLNDPHDAHAEGSPGNWLIGGPDNEADVLLIIASDDRDNMIEEVTRIEDTIYAPRQETADTNGRQLHSGVQVLFKQVGATLPPPLTGHEHFGFRDGVSQPGVRGRLSDQPTDFLTLRQNPHNVNQGKPGQDLLWPGEFVFGYRGQAGSTGDKEVKDPGPVAHAGPSWAKDGSFLVFRRLRQDVAGFHRFLGDHAHLFADDADRFGAECVGRWKSGAPTLRAPEHDDLTLAGADCANNNFEFQEGTEVATPNPATLALCSQVQMDLGVHGTDGDSQPDPDGHRAPFAAHIRKSYPRNDENPSLHPPLKEEDTQTHRLLRRGIPFGGPLNEQPDAPFHDAGNRGLLFLAYQTSIERQFEFVIRNWVNDPGFKEAGAGHDPVLGQNAAGTRTRQFVLHDGNGVAHTVELEKDWVIPTGGGYFFAPSIHALTAITEKTI